MGPTGSGKTSLVALISRLYDPTEGEVLLDGVDVREATIRSVRQAVAVVSDDPFLFSASIAENIAYARPGAGREQVEQAARRAQAHDFITSLPQGYETQVGERGLTLSGGQRQRLAIARALLSDPRVLVLDDATSSVDASTEQSIKVALAEAMAGRTTFVIAHRLSTIALADEIVVLDHGHLVAQGAHAELLQSSPPVPRDRGRGLPAGYRGHGRVRRPRGARRQSVRRRAMSAMGTGRGGGNVGGRIGLGPGVARPGQWDGERASRGNRGRNLRGLLALLAPYRTRVATMLFALVLGTCASLAPPLLARLAIDKGINQHDTESARVRRRRLPAVGGPRLGAHPRPDLPRGMGRQRAWRTCDRIFNPPPAPADRLLREPPAGVLISRSPTTWRRCKPCHGLGGDALPVGPDAIEHRGALCTSISKLALLTFCVVPFVAGASIWFRLVSAGAFRRTRETIGSITGYLQETLSGIRVIRSFGQEPRPRTRFAELNEDNREANMITVRLNATYFPAWK